MDEFKILLSKGGLASGPFLTFFSNDQIMYSETTRSGAVVVQSHSVKATGIQIQPREEIAVNDLKVGREMAKSSRGTAGAG